MVTSPAHSDSPATPPIRFFLVDRHAVRWGIPVQLGERRVLHPGRWRWLRAVAWLVLVFFLTAAAFGLPLQAAVDGWSSAPCTWPTPEPPRSPVPPWPWPD